MNELIQCQKPELIVLAEKKKLRDYPIETRKSYAVKLIAKLLNLLAVNDGKTEQHNILAIHLCDYYGHVSFEQIDKAFGLFVAGKLKTKPFQQLNAVVFGSVMNDYFEYENEQLKVYRLKLNELKENTVKISETERLKLIDKHITEMTLQFLKTGEIEANYMYLYYELFKQKKLPIHNKKYTDWIKKRVHKKLYKSKGVSISNLENNKRKALIKFYLGKGKNETEINNILKEFNLLLIPKEDYQIKKTLKAIQTGKIDISYHCRNLILKDYLNKKLK
jgi:hypothetical protein